MASPDDSPHAASRLRLVMAAEALLRVLFHRLRFDTVTPVHDTFDEAIAEAAFDSPGRDERPPVGTWLDPKEGMQT